MVAVLRETLKPDPDNAGVGSFKALRFMQNPAREPYFPSLAPRFDSLS
ncbi:MAG: hypothetical protein RL661_1265 [Pseudomonadota bacterium]|jgi:hypothetical protein